MIRASVIISTVIAASVLMPAIDSQNTHAGGLGCINPKDCRCELSQKQVDVEKSCFEVECKTICIPKVVFPWQTGNGLFGLGLFNCGKSACDSCDASSCDGKACEAGSHNGAFTKTVKVLSKSKYTEPGTEYAWSVKEGGCDDGCDEVKATSQALVPSPSIAELQVPQPILNIAPVQVR